MAQILVVGTVIAAVLIMFWSLTERIPVYLHVYTVAVVVLAVTTSASWISSKPRLLLPAVLPAVLLALPVARLLAPLRTAVLVPLVGVLTVATTWFCLYVTVIAKWTPWRGGNWLAPAGRADLAWASWCRLVTCSRSPPWSAS